jgi:hypothetical protein
MSDLTDFLLARIDEDERWARDATRGVWSIAGEDDHRSVIAAGGSPVLNAGGEFCGDLWLDAADLDLAHIVRWDPARVLAECEAKRRIVDKCVPRVEITDMGSADRQFIPGPPDMALLRLLALPYADHPDYRDEWRP